MTASNSTAAVVILTRLPRSRGVFDYLPPKGARLGPGDLVEAPFRGRPQYGVVLRLPKTPGTDPRKLLPVGRLVVRQFVPAPLLEALERTAERNASSLATLMSVALPELPKKFVPPKFPEAKSLPARSKPGTTDVVCGNIRERAEVALPLIQRALARKQQVLILVPERDYAAVWQKLLKARGVPVETYTAELTPAQRRALWLRARAGEASVIVGTRVASFLPFARLGGILADSPDNENHLETEQEPKYDAVRVAQELAHAAGVSLVRLSPAPRLSDRENSSPWRLAKRDWNARIVDMRRQPAKQLVSEELRLALDGAMKRNQRAALYLNKRGELGVLQCDDCGYSPACPACRRPLALDAAGRLNCYHCGTEEEHSLACPRCRGANMSGSGLGLDALAKELQQMFPYAALEIVEGLQGKAEPLSAQLLVGNRALLGHLPKLDLGLAALIRPDAELRLPEYAARERLWSVARHLAASAAQCYVQTRDPENLLWSALNQPDGKAFYESEMSSREQYRYPPAVTLVRCTVQSASLTEAQHDMHLAASQIRRTFGEQAEVIGPYPDYYVTKRGRYRFHTLLKLPRGASIAELAAGLPDPVRIDVDPRYVLS